MSQLVSYSSSSSDEGSSKQHDNSTHNYFGLSDEEGIENFTKETLLHEESLKLDCTLNDLSFELSHENFGPVKRPNQEDTSPYVKKIKKFVASKPKKPENCINTSKETKTRLNPKLKLPKVAQNHYLPFKICTFESEIDKKCISSLEWYYGNGTHKFLATSLNGSISVWNWTLEKSTFNQVCHTGGCKKGLWKGDQIFSVGYDKCGRLWDVCSEKEIFHCENNNYVTSCCLVENEENILLTGTKDIINAWDIRTENTRPCQMFNIGCGQVLDFNFLPNSNELVCCGDNVSRDSCDRNLSVWDFKSGAILSNEIYHERYSCVKIKLDPLRKQFVAQTNGSYIAIFSAKHPYRMNHFKRYEAHKVVGYPIDCTFSPDYGTMASGDLDGKVFFYNANTTNVQSVLNCKVHSPITSLAWNNSSHKLVVGSWNGQLQFWTSQSTAT